MKKSTILILVVVVLIGGAIYFYMAGGSAPASDTLEEDPEVQASANRVLSLLNQIKSLRIDETIFSSPEYGTLVDNTVSIPPLPVGRVNPFAPLPGVPSNLSSARSSSQQRR